MIMFSIPWQLQSPPGIYAFKAPSISCSGNNLAKILKEEGTFEAMELRVKEIVRDEETNRTKGGWHTAVSLSVAPYHWTE